MERIDSHTLGETAPATPDEQTTEPYEPPSLTELGSFLELMAGNSVDPVPDSGGVSAFN